jgi:hypothetical protein
MYFNMLYCVVFSRLSHFDSRTSLNSSHFKMVSVYCQVEKKTPFWCTSVHAVVHNFREKNAVFCSFFIGLRSTCVLWAVEVGAVPLILIQAVRRRNSTFWKL